MTPTLVTLVLGGALALAFLVVILAAATLIVATGAALTDLWRSGR